MTDAFKNLAKGATVSKVELPSVEQMRYEVETGDFSPESLAIAEEIHKSALLEDSREYMERTNRELREMAIAEEDAGKSKAPKPSQIHVKKATKALEDAAEALRKTGDAAERSTTAFKELGETVGKVEKKPFVPQDHLTHRPFKSKALFALRDELRKTQHIKIR